ncbi:MAG: methyltransferase [Marinifilaceae bacterium]|jgi:tRNA1Val (adenine37-N6)-methyltransferase|nr:methyltransferase [Marinifilaceae bacterium]
MAKESFQFKQFEVYHQNSSMKVGIDGVLIGAWANINNQANILDIGTGSGLIALMAAQRSDNESSVTAIDIDENSIIEASNNFINSKWSDKIRAKKTSIQDFSISEDNKYDTIISNPPFFESGIAAKTKSRTQARHVSSLSFEDLCLSVSRIMSENGSFSLILPTSEKDKFIEKANQNNLFLTRVCEIYPKPEYSAKRIMMEFNKHKTENIINSSITIETEKRHIYTNEYIQLTKEFYLKF